MEEGRNTFKILTTKPTEISPKCRWEGIIRIDLKEVDIVLYCFVLY
jgi:hypothetical protein